jgi:GntR family transcriptional repressor for pyruvate dehydrogenase complex
VLTDLLKTKGTKYVTEKNVFFSPLKTKRAFEEISAEIKKLIIQGVLKPGDKLPPETEIARQFNVGRQTVREAFRILELSGFISVRKGQGGPIIIDTVLNTLSNAFLDVMQIENVPIDEATEARLDIEKLVLEHTVRNARESDIEKLLQNISLARQKIEQGILAFDENISFHVLLAEASRNRVFVIVVKALMTIVADYLSRVPTLIETSRKICDEHEGILRGIMEKDGKKALTLMDTHLRGQQSRFWDSNKKILSERQV